MLLVNMIFHSLVVDPKNYGESLSAAADTYNWGAPILLKTEVPLQMTEGTKL